MPTTTRTPQFSGPSTISPGSPHTGPSSLGSLHTDDVIAGAVRGPGEPTEAVSGGAAAAQAQAAVGDRSGKLAEAALPSHRRTNVTPEGLDPGPVPGSRLAADEARWIPALAGMTIFSVLAGMTALSVIAALSLRRSGARPDPLAWFAIAAVAGALFARRPRR